MKGIIQIKDKIEKSIFNIVLYFTLIMFAQTLVYYFSNVLGSEILQRILLAVTIISLTLLLVTLSLISIDSIKKIKNK